MMKSVILFALMASAAMGQQYSCQPGSFFKDDCNLCTCSLDGRSAACTDMQCVGESSESQKFCEPGKEFKIDQCNTCTCSKDGSSALCTLEHCAPLAKKLFAAAYCKPNSVFQLDSCNTCRCSKDGSKAFCTLANCPEDKPVISNLPSQVCKPYSQFKDYCNTCSCAADGMSFACTRMMCDKDIWNEDGSVKVVKSQKEQVCKPRTQFNDYCNICTCNEDGSSYACTRMLCDKDIWNKDGSLKVVARPQRSQVCKPHTQFNDYCNVCTCNADGSSYGCTAMLCDKDVWNQDGSRKVVAKSRKSQVCKPFSQFKDYCNICGCAADGMSFACTRMMCDKDIWNKDGSLKVVAKPQKTQVCKPQAQFNDYCNICTCNEDGSSYACTIMFCDKDIWNQDGSKKVVTEEAQSGELERTCEPGSIFSPDSCNTCICNTDGTQAACTRKLCISNLNKAYEHENNEEWGPAYREGDKCTPGKLFYSECNRCVCGASGNSAFCTFMKCPTRDN